MRIEGSGHVGSINQEEITCPPDCDQPYGRIFKDDAPPYWEAHITAYPDEGARFLGWTGAKCLGTFDTSCMLLLDRDHSIVARFTWVPPPSLTVARSGSGYGTVTSARPALDDPDARVRPGNIPVVEDVDGVDCGVRCKVRYYSGTQLVLTATAGAGSRFVGWGGPDADCLTQTRPFCVIRIEGVERITATFESTEDA